MPTNYHAYCCCSPDIESISLNESPPYSGGLGLCVDTLGIYWERLQVQLYMVKNEAHVVKHTHVTYNLEPMQP